MSEHGMSESELAGINERDRKARLLGPPTLAEIDRGLLLAEVRRLQGEVADLMKAYERSQYAESRLETAMLKVLGFDHNASPCWKWGDDWYFDTYDSSVELLGAQVGAQLTPAELDGLSEIGIWLVYVSYSDGTALLWNTKTKTHGACSPRKPSTEGRGTLVAALRARLQQYEPDGERDETKFCPNCGWEVVGVGSRVGRRFCCLNDQCGSNNLLGHELVTRNAAEKVKEGK